MSEIKTVTVPASESSLKVALISMQSTDRSFMGSENRWLTVNVIAASDEACFVTFCLTLWHYYQKGAQGIAQHNETHHGGF